MIAKPQTASIDAARVAGGIELSLHLKVTTLGGGELTEQHDIAPVRAEAKLRCAGGSLSLGAFVAVPHSISLADHGWEADATFTATLPLRALNAIEETRAGQSFTIEASFFAEVFVDGRRHPHVSRLDHTWQVDRDAWLDTLKRVRGFDTLVIEVPLEAELPDDLHEARSHLAAANEARLRGGHGHQQAVAESRKVLDAIEQAGFGDRAPKDVHLFLTQKAGTLSLAERRAALHAALKLYFAPAHHAGSGGEQLDHLDSALALSAVATLLKLIARDRIR